MRHFGRNLARHFLTYCRYQVIGPNNVAVPTHFFKVIVGELESSRDLEMEAYVLPNEPIPDNVALHTFQVRRCLPRASLCLKKMTTIG